MIQIDRLSKLYGKNNEVSILSNINLRIDDGQVVALLGHNGSGKSTLIKCLVGVINPTKGTVTMDGFNTFKNRKKIVSKIGVVFNQKPSFIIDLNVYDNLLYYKSIYNIENSQFENLLTLVDSYLGIKNLYQKPYRKLSFGERVKCEITSVLLHSPKYIILDEPTIGLDYNAKKGLYQLLYYLKNEKLTTIIITTHEVDYIEGICDRAIILSQGKIKYDGTPKMISNCLNNLVTISIKFDNIIDEVEAESIFENSETVNKVDKSFSYTCSNVEEKDKFIAKVTQIFSICSINTATGSLREVLENVLDEIDKNK